MAPGDQAEIDVKQIGVLADDMDHPEGVAVAPDGTVWCGGEAGQIYRIDPAKGRASSAEQVAGTGGFVLGIAFAPDGSWMAICDPKNRAVMRMDTVTMRVDTLAETVGDTHLETPNYPVFGSDGTLYVSDSGSFEQATGRVYAFDADGRGWLWAGSELTFANGMTLDANESYLYVVESFLPSICRFRIRPDGSAGPRELFTNEVVHVPDGLAFDIEGNLYCPCYATPRRASTRSTRSGEPRSLSRTSSATPSRTARTWPSADRSSGRSTSRTWDDGTSPNWSSRSQACPWPAIKRAERRTSSPPPRKNLQARAQ